MRRFISVIAVTGLIASLGALAPSASAAEPAVDPTAGPVSPRVAPLAAPPIAGTPAEILQEIPVTEPLTVGYKAGLFLPRGAKKQKDKRGCTLRNQLLIQMASKKPKVGRKCKLTGGEWKVDFGTKTIKKPRQVVINTLLPDKYVYAQGAYGWNPQQRKTYAENYAPNKSLGAKTRSSVSPFLDYSSQQLFSKPVGGVIREIHRVLTPGSSTSQGTAQDNAQQAELDRLAAKHPELFSSWTVATTLNAKSWGLSFSPGTNANFQVTIEKCAEVEPEKGQQNPCATTYSIPNESARYGITAIPMSASIVPPTVTASGATTSPFFSYGTPQGAPIDRFLFGIHAPADWVSDVETGFDGPIKEETIPNVPVGYLRLWDTETTWADVEPANGQWDWRKLDKQIQMAQILNARVMLVLGGTPGWAGGGGPSSPPNNIADWRDYVRTVACRYGPSITSYEVWNEANLTTFWRGSPEQMADLTAAAFEEIRGCNPSAIVVAANTTSRATGSFGTFFPEYLQELKKRNWPVDAYSVHSYPTASGGANDRIRGIGAFRAMLALAGAPQTTVFDTEINYGLAGLGEGKVDLTGANAMTLMSRTFIDSVRYGFGSTFWFVWTARPDSKFGIQFTREATAEQQAWRTTYDWLVGAQFQRCFETTDKIVICQFNRGAENFSIVWRGDYKDGLFNTTPGFFARLGSRTCNLFGTCEEMSVNSTTTISPMPMRIDGAPLVTGTEDAETAPAAPSVTDPRVEYGDNGSATYSVSINPDRSSTARVESFQITVSECTNETGRDCKVISDETIAAPETLRYSLPLGDDVVGYVRTSVVASNQAGKSQSVSSDLVRVGAKVPQPVTDLVVGVSRDKEIDISWAFVPARPNTSLARRITIERLSPIDSRNSVVIQETVAADSTSVTFNYDEVILLPLGGKFAEGDKFRACVTMTSPSGDGPSSCQDGVITTNLPAVRGANLFIDSDYTTVAGVARINTAQQGAENVRGLELQWYSPKTKSWRTIPSAIPGSDSAFIRKDDGPGDRFNFGVTVSDGVMSSQNPPSEFRIRTVSQPRQSGGPWLYLKGGGRNFTGGVQVR